MNWYKTSQQNSRVLLSDIINEAKSKVGVLHTGNCGTFAYALRKILQEDGHDASLYFVTSKDLSGEDILESAEGDYYHIFVTVGGAFVDGHKVYRSPQEAISFFDTEIAPEAHDISEHEFGEDYFSDEDKDNDLRRTIDWNTNACYSQDYFYNIIRSILNSRNIRLSGDKDILIK